MPIMYLDHLNAVVFTHGKPITCPECGSLDEVNYHKGMDLYSCAFDGSVFDAQGQDSNIDIPSYTLCDGSGWMMNLKDIIFLSY